MDTTSYHNMLGGCATHMCQLGYVPNSLWVTQLDDKRGFGVVAGADIKQGQFVCEYVGELITRELAQTREKVRAPPTCHQKEKSKRVGMLNRSRVSPYIMHVGITHHPVQHYNDLGLYYLHDIAGTYERSHADDKGEYTIDPTYFGNVGAWHTLIRVLCL